MRYLDLNCRIPVAETPDEVAQMLIEVLQTDKKLFRKMQRIVNRKVAIQFVDAQINAELNPPQTEAAVAEHWDSPKSRRK